MKRYVRNHTCIGEVNQEKLKAASVCVLGCGGLGGYIIEMLVRLGVGRITVVDGDVFDETNLNRQLLSNEDNIGQSKANQAAIQMHKINSDVEVKPISKFVTKENGYEILKGHHIVVDALDDIKVRKDVCALCSEMGIPYVYGAIAGWYGQVATIYPGDHTLDILYQSTVTKGKEIELGNPSFTPATIASVQVAEVVKLITGKGQVLRHAFMHMDLLNNEFEVFKLEQ